MSSERLVTEQLKNLLHTILLLAAMAAVSGALGWMLAGQAGLQAALIFCIVSLLFFRQIPSRFVMQLYRARPVSVHEWPALYAVVRDLSQKAGLPKVPRLYYSSSKNMNAFAAGSRRDPAVCVTRGLLQLLDTREMAGILAHEISHIRSNDLQVMAISSILVRATHLLSAVGLLISPFILAAYLLGEAKIPVLAFALIFSAPTLSTLMQLALSRTREFKADIGSSMLMGSPYPLVSALKKLERFKQAGWRRFLLRPPVASPHTVFSTHPETGDRIKRLLSLSDTPPDSIYFSPVVYKNTLKNKMDAWTVRCTAGMEKYF